MSGKFVSHANVVLKKVQEAMSSSMEEIKKIAVEDVQYQILYGYKDRHGKDGHTEIVDTGRLFDSIESDVKRDSQNSYTVTVETDVPYAVYVHEGTRKLKARRFMKDAMQKNEGKYKKIIEKNLSTLNGKQ